MKHIIVGTAGHVDHGKTSLIQALTGTNTDRLKEEQERGMTIDIGFASLRLPDGTDVSIVDVPGHERFLKNMLAGATGVDVVLLVVAADEGVMPQTIEHLEIIKLLNITNGVVALTKCDLVERDWIGIVTDDIRARLADNALATSPIIPVSSTTGKGLDALKRALQSAVSRTQPRNRDLPFRLPVDRVFTSTGFGTVVTGTLVAGVIRQGDSVEIGPSGVQSRVRGIQVHNKKVEMAEAGNRVAINLTGVEVGDIARGVQICAPGNLTPTNLIDARFTMLGTDVQPMKDMSRVRLYIGTDEIIGRIRILDDRNQLGPGESAYVQFQGEAPTGFCSLRKDYFVVRSYSPMQTIGGGVVLDTTLRRKHRKNEPDTIAALTASEAGTPQDLIVSELMIRELGVNIAELSKICQISPTDVDEAVKSLIQAEQVVQVGQSRVVARVKHDLLKMRVVQALTKYHERFPLRTGMPKEELRNAAAPESDVKQFNGLLSVWEAQEPSSVVIEGGSVRLPEFEVQLNDRQLGLLTRIEEYYVECGIATPTLAEVSTMVRAPQDAVSALLRVGVNRRQFCTVADGLYYAVQTVENAKALLRTWMATHDAITVGEFRDLTHSNRKLAMQMLEHLDFEKFTLRNGDARTLA